MATIQSQLTLKEIFALKEGFMPSQQFVDAIFNQGIDNVHFLVPLGVRTGIGSYSSEKNDVACKIVQDRYKLSDCFKVVLEPIENPDNYQYLEYYLDDLESLLRSGYIKFA